MEWYPGSINDAVKTSKLNKAVFVVFVVGNDEASLEMTRVIDTPEISSSLKKNDFVAIKLESGTEDYNFFAQIYQLVPVPSIFFIGHSGQPVEVVAGTVTASNLKEKINGVLVKVGKTNSNISSVFINAEQSAASASNIPQTSTTVSNVVDQQLNRVTESPSTDVKPTSSGSADTKSEKIESTMANLSDSNKSAQQLTTEEKVERARKLIELQKQQQIEKEREEEKRRELERREIGKSVQNTRRQQQDLELALAHEERMKEKAMEREARERVMQQIAQDKLERKHREQALLNQVAKNPQNQDPPQQTAPFVGDGYARIQFKLPSGNPHMGKFEANTTLRQLRVYVSSNIDLPFRQFSMSMSFPRRDLTTEDDDKTLLDLELVPTAVILILPDKNSGSSAVARDPFSDNFFFRLAWALIWPVCTVYNYLASYFSGASNGGTNNQSTDSSLSSGSERSSAFSANSVGHSSDFMGRNMGETSRTVRTRGNIHRLHSSADDNDENNTWNGNSTQQM